MLENSNTSLRETEGSAQIHWHMQLHARCPHLGWKIDPRIERDTIGAPLELLGMQNQLTTINHYSINVY